MAAARIVSVGVRWTRARAVTLPLVAWAGVSCSAALQRGAPLADPAGVAAGAHDASGARHPTSVWFDWEYVDERGNLRGEGRGRVNPPDRFRLDLFSTGEGSMSATLVDARLSTLGELEDVELPEPTFLYAMAGIFRPGDGPPSEGFESEGSRVVAYPTEDGATRYYFLRDGRLHRVEQRRGGRVERRIELEWGEDATWPLEARYRDSIVPNRVRWALVEIRIEGSPFPPDIYDLGSPP